MKDLTPSAAAVQRFCADLDALIEPRARIGIAVSGGPDSLALLLLAAAARPGLVEAATADHGLRPEGRAEAEMVARLCQGLGVPHEILTVDWLRPGEAGIQAKAREARYEVLGQWLRRRGLEALLTAHHLDDQVETFVMRLNRGAGVRGLAGMRPVSDLPTRDGGQRLLRPLLGWRRSELEAICATAGLEPAEDPSNREERFERVRIRRALAEADWLDAEAIARSAAHLACADEALDWAVMGEWERRVTHDGDRIRYQPSDAPAEIRRRIVATAVGLLGHEGEEQLRGRELDRLLEELAAGRTATLRGVQCTGGAEWLFAQAPPRR